MTRGRRLVRRSIEAAAALALFVAMAAFPVAAQEPPPDPSRLFAEPVLDEPASGEEAVDLIGDRLDEVADLHGMAEGELEQLLLSDETLHVDPNGMLLYVDPAPDPALSGDVVVAAAPFPYEDTFKLHSKPGSNRTIYLDFNGHTVASGKGWPAGTYTAFDTNGAPGSFGNAERDKIQDIWMRVAEDYRPFDVDVTTELPGAGGIARSSASDNVYGTRLVITNSSAGPVCGSCGGVAYLGVFNLYSEFPGFPGHDHYQPAWCFAGSLSMDPKSIAECASHEIGHNLGLDHDGKGFDAYYLGHDPWAPIMGVGYYQPVTQWSKGQYADATNKEGDYSVMASHGVAKRGDDHANTTSGATVLVTTRTGIVTADTDYDMFRFNAPSSGSVTFVAEPAPVSPNLDIVLKLKSASGTTLVTSAPTVARVDDDIATGLDASITFSVTAGTTYYLEVSGGSYLNATTGYTRWGSIGAFTVKAQGMVGVSMCNGLLVTIQGTNGADTLTGTSGADVIDGMGGEDDIKGLGGNDTICGGDGGDTIWGQAGVDKLYGGGGDDTLRGGAGADSLYGDLGKDTLNGDAGADILRGGDGEDTLNGGAGNDDARGGQRKDTVNGGGGADELYGDGGNDTVNGNDGADKLFGGTGTDGCHGGAGTDTASSCETKTSIP